jgi:hypothetical protein
MIKTLDLRICMESDNLDDLDIERSIILTLTINLHNIKPENFDGLGGYIKGNVKVKLFLCLTN